MRIVEINITSQTCNYLRECLVVELECIYHFEKGEEPYAFSSVIFVKNPTTEKLNLNIIKFRQ